MIYTRFMWHMEQMIHTHYEISSTIKHKGERGRQREDGLATFLKDNLPEAYGVATGELIPSEGEDSSPQCDIIVYDRQYMPIISKSNIVQQVPIEAAYAVIEMKSTINSKELEDAFDKFSRIRAMPRCKPFTSLADNMRRGPVFYLFGYKLNAATSTCIDYVRTSLRPESDDEYDTAVFALDTGGSVVLFDEESSQGHLLWLNTTGKVEDRQVYRTLGFFFASLLNDLQAIDLGRVDFFDVLKPL